MPGIAQLSVDRVAGECAEVKSLGISAVILFGIPEQKDAFGSEAYAERGIVQQAIAAIRAGRLRVCWLSLTFVCANIRIMVIAA